MSEFLIQRLIRMASRPLTAPTCPFDGSELDLHFHGGASCPQCGHEFELGQNDQLLPSDRSVEEHAALWPDTIPHFAADEWMPDLSQRTKPEKPYPFIYHPTSGWLAWGQQNGLHEHIQNSLYQQGIRVPNDAMYGRYYPSDDQALIYDPSWKSLPPREREKHLTTILRNAPGRPQEAPVGPSSDFWGTLSSTTDKDDFPLEEEEWQPTIPTLEEMVEIERWHRPVD